MDRNAPGRLRRTVAVATAVSALTAVAACGGGSGNGDSAAKPTGKVTLTFWGQENGMPQAVAAWNKTHPDIQVKFTKVTLGDTGYQKITAAVKAGNGPCTAELNAQQVVTYAAQGMVQDVTQYVGTYKDKFTEAAWKAASPGGRTYAVPESASPNFFAYRTDLFKKYGLTVPTTWDEFIAAGQKLVKANPKLKLMNYAPEDPSGFVGLNWEAGATWYKQESNGWKIDFLSPESLKAAGVLQKMVDSKMLSSVSYTDPGIWKTWDDGGTLSMTTSTWQLPIYSKVFPKSDGNWAIIPVPQYAAGQASTDSGYNTVGVMKGCKYPQQAAEFGGWMGTSPTALKLLADPVNGAGWFPALRDVSPYLTGITPKKMIPDSTAATQVVTKAAAEVNTTWEFGPDYATMYTKMASYWPQVLAGKMSAVDLLKTMQAFVLKDLKSQGISASAG
ncbi:ABC transporter substrate-binding protein [Streptomyces sp. NPDC059373]